MREPIFLAVGAVGVDTEAVPEVVTPDTSILAEPRDEVKAALGNSCKPPKEGPCKRCGQDKPLNRLMLCYPCWVKTELEKSGWREGTPHPDWCRCEGLMEHDHANGSARGGN